MEPLYCYPNSAKHGNPKSVTQIEGITLQQVQVSKYTAKGGIQTGGSHDYED